MTEPTRQLEAGITERSILAEIDHIREHIETPEEAAGVAPAVEFDQIRAVVQQLEAVAVAAKAVERDLAQELATTNRLSASTARLIRDQLATTLRALAEAGWLGVAARRGSTRARKVIHIVYRKLWRTYGNVRERRRRSRQTPSGNR